MSSANYSSIGYGIFVGGLLLFYFGIMMVLASKKLSDEKWSPASYQLTGGIMALIGLIMAVIGYMKADGDIKNNLTFIVMSAIFFVVLGALLLIFAKSGKVILGTVMLVALIFEIIALTVVMTPDDDNDYDSDHEHNHSIVDDYSYFSNDYGTPSTKCAIAGCSRNIASSGDTNCCSYHSNSCLECGCYIDSDAMYCMDCIYDAAG